VRRSREASEGGGLADRRLDLNTLLAANVRAKISNIYDRFPKLAWKPIFVPRQLIACKGRIMTIFVIIVLLAVAGSIYWVIRSKTREENYTREKYAFRCLAAAVTLITLAITSVSSKKGLVDHLIDLTSAVTGFKGAEDAPTPLSEKMLICVLVVIGIYFIHKSYADWKGPRSVDEMERDRSQQGVSLVSQALDEGLRLIKRAPERELYNPNRRFSADVSAPSMPNIVWHEHAKELFGLWYSTSSFLTSDDPVWDSKMKCWLGRETRRDIPIFLFCWRYYPTDVEQREMIAYMRSVTANGNHLAYVVYPGDPGHKKFDELSDLTLVTEDYLLDNIVDFTDYFNEVKRRVEKHKFPDTGITITDLYVPSSLCTLSGEIVSDDMGEYVANWVRRPAGRHLAVLGEYGQGKSTGALMFVYQAVVSKLANSSDRVPILLELRGKSPANLLPQELLGTWAQQYKIHALALGKLLIAGRLILIFEGFDEMANVADVEARLSHFRSLWRFAYPESKIVFTGRQNLFFEDKELEVVFQSAAGEKTTASCEVLQLMPFNIEKIASSLRWVDMATRNEIVAAAKAHSQILDVVSRPSLLYIVATIWHDLATLIADGKVTSAHVIDRFILHSYQRQAEKEQSIAFMVLSKSERRYFHEGLAVYMASRGTTNQITATEMERAITRLYDAYPEDAHVVEEIVMETDRAPLKRRISDPLIAIDAITTDVRTHGILTNDPARRGAFRFAHKSFYELLFAKSYAYDMLGLDSVFYGAIRKAMDKNMGDIQQSTEIVRFFSEILVGKIIERGSDREIPVETLDLIIGVNHYRPIMRPLARLVAVARIRATHSTLYSIVTFAVIVISCLAPAFAFRRSFLFWLLETGVPDAIAISLPALAPGALMILMVRILFGGSNVKNLPVLWAAVLLYWDASRGNSSAWKGLVRLVGRTSAEELHTKAQSKWQFT
jgi:hypothetical protein